MATRKVTIGKCQVRGKSRWRVRYWREGKPRRAFFKTKTDAESEAARIRADLEHSGAAWFDLPARDRQQLMLAYQEALEHGVDIFAAIRAARQGGNAAPAVPMVKEVIRELVLAKKAAGRDPDYADGLETNLLHFFKGLEEQRIDRISLAQVKAILQAKSLAYRSTVRSRLSILFNFAVREGYRVDNPCARVEPVIYHKPPPQVFTIAQVQLAVKWLRAKARHGLAWFALSTFCGLRPEEAQQTVPKRDIDFNEGLIRVEKQTTKVRQRRVVYPRPEAMAFLKWALAKKRGGVLPISSLAKKRLLAGQVRKLPASVRFKRPARRTRAEGLRGALGFKTWPKDITRHTAASYWIGAGGSVGEVAAALGNSESVLKRDYKALVTRAQAEEFWKVVKGLAG